MIIDIYKFRPARNMVLVCAEQRRKVTNAGIILPTETTGEKLNSSVCRVISFGATTKTVKLELEVGHRIFMRDYFKYALRVLTDEKWPDGEEKHYALVHVDDIVGILEEGVDIWVYNFKEKP